LSYSVVTIFMTVCGGAGAEGKDQPPTTEQGDALSPLPAALVRRGIGRLFCRDGRRQASSMTSAYSVWANTPRRFSRMNRLMVHRYLLDRNRHSHCPPPCDHVMLSARTPAV